MQHGFRHLPQRLLVAAVRAYQLLFSAWLGSSCRYAPSCSAFSLQALQRHGAAAGSYLTLRRIARCHPWCVGGDDPVPDAIPRLFARWRRAPQPPSGPTGPHPFDSTAP